MAGDPRGASMAAGQLALAHLNQGRFADAEAAAERSLSLLAGRGEQRTEGYVLGVKARICHAQGRLDEARAMLSTALAIHRAVGDRWSEGVHLGYVGNVAFEERRFADARAAYRDAVAKLRGAGERHYTAIYLAALGAAEIAAGAPAEASACFEDAAAALAGVRVQATRVDVALWAAFADAGRDRRAAAAPIALAEAPAPDGGPSVTRNSEDVRFALRMLARALAEADAAALPAAPAEAPRAPRSATQPLLVIGPDARWFRVEGREPVSLFKARAARLILARLAGLRLASPGAALPLEAIFEAGWPGERIAPKAAANRVYVTLSKLKSLGLRGLIVSRDDGFLIDPAAVVLEAIGAGEAGE